MVTSDAAATQELCFRYSSIKGPIWSNVKDDPHREGALDAGRDETSLVRRDAVAPKSSRRKSEESRFTARRGRSKDAMLLTKFQKCKLGKQFQNATQKISFSKLVLHIFVNVLHFFFGFLCFWFRLFYFFSSRKKIMFIPFFILNMCIFFLATFTKFKMFKQYITKIIFFVSANTDFLRCWSFLGICHFGNINLVVFIFGGNQTVCFFSTFFYFLRFSSFVLSVHVLSVCFRLFVIFVNIFISIIFEQSYNSEKWKASKVPIHEDCDLVSMFLSSKSLRRFRFLHQISRCTFQWDEVEFTWLAHSLGQMFRGFCKIVEIPSEPSQSILEDTC